MPLFIGASESYDTDAWESYNLKKENAKLREDLEFERSENGWAREFLNRMGQKCGTKDCPSLVAYVNKIESDNVKLRKLMRDMWHGMCDHDRCGTCEHWNEDYNGCEFCARMQELGVETEQ